MTATAVPKGNLLRCFWEVDLRPGDHLVCHKDKRHRYDSAADLEVGENETMLCPVCGVSGFYVSEKATRTRREAGKVENRLPKPLSGDYIPTPRALREHAPALGLDIYDVSVIEALWSHSYYADSVIYPGIDRIASLALCGRDRVIKSIKKLDAAGLIKREQSRRGARVEKTTYSLDALWARLAKCARDDQNGDSVVVHVDSTMGSGSEFRSSSHRLEVELRQRPTAVQRDFVSASETTGKPADAYLAGTYALGDDDEEGRLDLDSFTVRIPEAIAA